MGSGQEVTQFITGIDPPNGLGRFESSLRPQHFAKAAKEESKIMPKYNPAELDALFVRCQRVLGADTFDRVVNSPPRWSGFATALEASIKHNDGDPSKVPDIQIEGALEVALEIWPYEAEAVANHFFKGGVL
jgi:hypothetical protein